MPHCFLGVRLKQFVRALTLSVGIATFSIRVLGGIPPKICGFPFCKPKVDTRGFLNSEMGPSPQIRTIDERTLGDTDVWENNMDFGVDSPFFSTIVLVKNRICFPWILMVSRKDSLSARNS